MITRRLPLRFTACFALALLTVGHAQADAYDAAMAQGVAARERATDNNDPASWDEALRRFYEADHLKPTKEAKFELGNAAEHLREDDLAFASYEDALELGLTGKAKELAERFMNEKASKVTRLDIQGPAGVTILIHGRKRAVLPLQKPLIVLVGSVVVRVETPSKKTFELEVETKAGKTAILKVADAPEEVEDRGPPPDLGKDARTVGWVLTGTGTALFLAGVSTTIIASVAIEKHRGWLAEKCVVLSGEDACTSPQPYFGPAAQRDVDAIATWKGARLAGEITLGIGVVVAMGGLYRLLTVPATSAPAPRRESAFVVPIQGGWLLGLQGAF